RCSRPATPACASSISTIRSWTSSPRTRTCPTPRIPMTGRASPARRASASSTSERWSPARTPAPAARSTPSPTPVSTCNNHITCHNDIGAPAAIPTRGAVGALSGRKRMQRLAADRARLVGQGLGDGRYRVTGEVTLPASPERVRACLTDVALLRRWAVGGKVGTRLSGGDGRYTFHFRMSSAMTMTMYGELRVDEPRRVVRHYSDARPGSDPGTGQERIVEYVLEPALAG